MVLDGLTPETIPSMELATGIPLVYRLKADTTVEEKRVLVDVSDIRILDAVAAERERGRLWPRSSPIASPAAHRVSFMWPFSVADAHAWWGGVIDERRGRQTPSCSAAMSTAGCRGTVQLGLDVAAQPAASGDVPQAAGAPIRAAARASRPRLMSALEDDRAGPEACRS